MSKSIPEPNYTQCPNVFYDEIMAEIETMSELKVTLVVIRQTFGWHREEHKLTLNLLETLTGMNRQQVVAGVKAAMARGYVGRRKVGQGYVYGLRVEGYEDQTPNQYEDHTPLKESKKERTTDTPKVVSVVGDAQSTENPVPLEKWVTDLLYDTAKARLGIRWSKDEYGYHLGRAKEMLAKDEPTREELEELPGAFMDVAGFKGVRADAVTALQQIRWEKHMSKTQAQKEAEKKAERERKRRELEAEYEDQAAPWEKSAQATPKLSKEEAIANQREIEEIMRRATKEMP